MEFLSNKQSQASSYTVRRDGLGTTLTDGVILQNATAAASGAQQISPASTWLAQGWKTNSTAGSQEVGFRAYTLPIQGAANPTGEWVVASSVNGGAYTRRFSVNTAGVVYANGYHFDVSGFGRGCGFDIVDDLTFQWTINGSARGYFAGNNIQLYTSGGMLQIGAAPDVALGRKAGGIFEVNNCTAIGTTPGNARDLMQRRNFLVETSSDPSASELSVAGSNAQDVAAIYTKNDKLVIAVNRSGTVNYLTIPLDGATTAWGWSTTAP